MMYAGKIGLGLSMALFTAIALGHHGDAGRFETDVSTITGNVVALQLINPHAGVLIAVPDEHGNTVTWHVEMEAPQRLQREFGWDRNTLPAGTSITVTGRRIKSGAPNINVTERARILLTETCEEIYHSRDLEPLAEPAPSC